MTFEREIRLWLKKAAEDVEMASRAIRYSPTLPDSAAFHSQQATEKALKGFLRASGGSSSNIPRTHDLLHLLGQVEVIDEELSQRLYYACSSQNGYAVDIRYPGPRYVPATPKEGRTALTTAAVAYQILRKATYRVLPNTPPSELSEEHA